MNRLVFLLEEMSTQKFLMNFLPELGFRKGEYQFPMTYQCKPDLLENFNRPDQKTDSLPVHRARGNAGTDN